MFYKKVNTQSNKACFDFITQHFKYHAHIAHNVKVYNLPFDSSEALKALEEDDYCTVNQTIRFWEEEHLHTEVYFSGRSGGYLTLRYRHNDLSPIEYNSYEEWKKDVIYHYGALKDYHSELVEEVKLIQDFDKLCDTLVDVVKELIEDMHYRESHTVKFEATRTSSCYHYDTLDDMKAHMQYMTDRGYKVFDKSEEELYAEFDMNELEKGEVVIE